ncbi:hypothetical protein ACJX0J_021308 [Zea mays]
MEHINNNIERYKAKLNPLSWEVGGFFYHEYINKKTLFFASNINQFDLYSILVDNLGALLTPRDLFILFFFVYKCFRKALGLINFYRFFFKKIMFSLLDNLILLEEKTFQNSNECFGCIAILDLSNVLKLLKRRA